MSKIDDKVRELSASLSVRGPTKAELMQNVRAYKLKLAARDAQILELRYELEIMKQAYKEALDIIRAKV